MEISYNLREITPIENIMLLFQALIIICMFLSFNWGLEWSDSLTCVPGKASQQGSSALCIFLSPLMNCARSHPLGPTEIDGLL